MKIKPEKKPGLNEIQPCSLALSSLPHLVIGGKTLVAAGHVTTQNLGGNKICWGWGKGW